MRIRQVAGFLTLVTLATAGPAIAQVGRNETSLLGGGVISNLAGRDVQNGLGTTRVGLMGAVQLVHPFTQLIGIQTEFGILQKGASLQFGGSTTQSSIQLSYFEIPVMARINFAGKYATWRPAIFAGPAVALNVGCKYKLGTQDGGSIESDCEQGGPQIKAFDFSAVAGASLEYGSFGLFARYDHGLVTIDASDAKDDVRNRALVFGFIWNTTSR